MDILKEVGSTASAQGSTALSEILGRRIDLAVPVLDIISPNDLKQRIATEKPIIVMQTQILSGLAGQKLFVILEEKSAYRLVDIFYKLNDDIKKGSLFTEMSMSLIKEIGNIIIFAYVGAIAYFLKRVIVPSLPVLINAPLSEVMRLLSPDYGEEGVMLIQSVFEEPKENITGNFWLVLTAGAAEEIKDACKKILNEL